MFRQFRVAATGLNALEKELLTITNNVSNVETVGFKRSRVEYENLFPEILQEVVQDSEINKVKPSGIEYGTGVRVVSTPKDFSLGTITVTNNPLDMAIKGDGFFRILLADGTEAYTRAGNFSVDANGKLVDVNGNIIDPEINFPENTTGIIINTDGTVLVQENNQLTQTEIGQLELVRFQNPSELSSIGNNLFKKETEASGIPVVGIAGEDGFGEIAQFFSESSNVNIIEELTRMIVVQRAFDIVSKSIQTGEAMMNSAIEIARGNSVKLWLLGFLLILTGSVQAISLDQVEKEIRFEIIKRNPQLMPTAVQVQLLNAEDLKEKIKDLSSEGISIQIQAPGHYRLLGRSSSWLSVRDQKKTVLRHRVFFNTEAFSKVCQAKQAIYPRTVLSKHLLQEVTTNVTSYPEGFAQSCDGLIGQESTAYIRSQSFLYPHLVRKPPLIRSKDRVHVLYENNGVAVKVEGEALEEGYLNELIEVKNIRSHKKIKAKVINHQLVKVPSFN